MIYNFLQSGLIFSIFLSFLYILLKKTCHFTFFAIFIYLNINKINIKFQSFVFEINYFCRNFEL